MKKSGLNEFYGSDPQLRAYHARYLDWLTATLSPLPILDLGCGSGVFLELVRERSRNGRGVELAAEAVEVGRAKGLDVAQGDVMQFLQSQSPAACSGIYCSHLIEHFSYPDACRLLELCCRVLAPAGRLIVITPNPVSLDVISETFWLDPTHIRPYPRPLLEKMMQRAGFSVVAAGHDDPPDLPRRSLPRRWFLRLLLGKHYGAMNTFVVGQNDDTK